MQVFPSRWGLEFGAVLGLRRLAGLIGVYIVAASGESGLPAPTCRTSGGLNVQHSPAQVQLL